jgi:hypothetical protein
MDHSKRERARTCMTFYGRTESGGTLGHLDDSLAIDWLYEREIFLDLKTGLVMLYERRSTVRLTRIRMRSLVGAGSARGTIFMKR